MKKLLFILLMFIFPLLLKGQINNEEYPKLLISNQDTFLILTIDQIKKLNIEHIEKNKFKELTDSLNKQVENYELVVIQDKELINNLKEQLILKDNIIIEKDGINEELTNKNKKIGRKLKRNVFFNKGLIVLSIVLGVLILK